MTVSISKTILRDQVLAALQPVDRTAPVLLHTDIRYLAVTGTHLRRDQLLSDYADIVADMAQSRTVLLPTFNYDYLRTRIYDIERDPCQVGQLNEFLRQRGLPRTYTPVFNFCLLGNGHVALEAATNPFGEPSTFSELVQKDGWVGFFGAPLSSNTFIHHVEELARIPYRYIKLFPGAVVRECSQQSVSLHYRVRPLIDGAVEYDWPRLQEDLLSEGLLFRSPLGRGRFSLFRSRELRDYWLHQLRTDPLWLLTTRSRAIMGMLFEKYGLPLTFEKVEGMRDAAMGRIP